MTATAEAGVTRPEVEPDDALLVLAGIAIAPGAAEVPEQTTRWSTCCTPERSHQRLQRDDRARRPLSNPPSARARQLLDDIAQRCGDVTVTIG